MTTTTTTLSSLERYDELVSKHIKESSTSRSGNLLLLPVEDNDNDNTKTIPICNMALLLALSDGGKDIGIHDGYAAYENAAAVALAMEHLNTHNGSVIPELKDLQNCPIKFTMSILDSQFQERHSVDTIIDVTSTDNPQRPCAILGAERSAVSMPTSIITGLRGYPQVSAFSTSPALNDATQYPLFGRTIPSDDATAVPVVLYLRQTLDVKYLGIIYINDSYGSSFLAGIQAAAQEYAPDLTIVSAAIPFAATPEDVERAVSVLAETQYRYFFGIVFSSQFDRVMTLAYEKGIAGTGNHTWLFADGAYGAIDGRKFSSSSSSDNNHSKDYILRQALKGTGVISPSAGLADGSMPVLDAFLQGMEEIRQHDGDLEYLISKTSSYIDPFDPQLIIKERPTFTNMYCPWLYDSVIALGLAACEATTEKNNYNLTLDGQTHFEQFTKSNFKGASGDIVLDHVTGSRVPESSHFVLLNFIHDETDHHDHNNNNTVVMKDVKSAIFDHGVWKTLKPYVYSDGTIVPHDDLPPLELDENFLSTGWRAAGLTMVTVAMALSVGFAVWTFVKRHDHVVRASQPIFLYLICIGVLIFVSSIIPLAFDEGVASPEGCTVACTSFVWQISIGFSVTFSALFTKTYRVNKIFKQPGFKRVKVTALDVAKPMVAILTANILILSLLTALAPVTWNTTVEAEDPFGRPTETRGFCDWNASIPYLAPLGVLNFGCLVFAVIQAYGARKIATEFQESEYIMKSMLVILLACFCSFPVLILTVDIPAAFYFVLAATIFVTGCSILFLIFLPKIQYMRLHHSRGTRPMASRTIISISNNHNNNGNNTNSLTQHQQQHAPQHDGASGLMDGDSQHHQDTEGGEHHQQLQHAMFLLEESEASTNSGGDGHGVRIIDHPTNEYYYKQEIKRLERELKRALTANRRADSSRTDFMTAGDDKSQELNAPFPISSSSSSSSSNNNNNNNNNNNKMESEIIPFRADDSNDTKNTEISNNNSTENTVRKRRVSFGQAKLDVAPSVLIDHNNNHHVDSDKDPAEEEEGEGEERIHQMEHTA